MSDPQPASREFSGKPDENPPVASSTPTSLPAERQMRRFVVQAGEPDRRLDVFLVDRFPAHSRAEFKRLIDASDVVVNGQHQKASYHIREGDTIDVRLPSPANRGPEPADIPLDVLYEDDDLVAINKPHGLVVHPAKGHWKGTLTAGLAFHFRQLSSVGGPTRPGIVHRLDRDTSGVILVAKNDRAHLNLANQFTNRSVEKEYFALCRGSIDRDRDSIELPIGVHPYHRERMAIRSSHPTSRDARTVFEVIERLRGFVAFRVLPKTGRTHQIRVHLTHIGCPILCDPLYSGQTSLRYGEVTGERSDERILLDRLALHARRICVDHPRSRRRMEFVAEIPAALETAVTVLRQFRRITPNQRGMARGTDPSVQ
jgi:23S rRNA pseudouridine1911/1915/1917 synthase